MCSRFGSGRGMSGGPKLSDFPCIHVSRVARVLPGRREKARTWTRQRAARADEPEPLRPSTAFPDLKSRRDAMGKPGATPRESYPTQPLALKGRDSMTHCALTGLRICWAQKSRGDAPGYPIGLRWSRSASHRGEPECHFAGQRDSEYTSRKRTSGHPEGNGEMPPEWQNSSLPHLRRVECSHGFGF